MFVPRVPLVLAEQHVDYRRILAHIDSRRRTVERRAAPATRRIGWLAVHQPVHPAGQIDDLAARLEKAFEQTALFGYREALAEIGRLRSHRPAPAARAAYQFPDAGKHAVIARGGLDAVRQLIRQRARKTAGDIAAAAATAAARADPLLPAAVHVAAATLAATKVLHNSVLELVGETLNLGRAAAAATSAEPPQFAMRSEQLDANTCEECDQLHGTIVEIGSGDYYDLMPPAGCLGGGRCRGIYVYGDTPSEVQLAA